MNVAVPVPRQVTTVHTPACPWTWRKPPAGRQVPIRVPMPPSRWRVGGRLPYYDGEELTEKAILLSIDVAMEPLSLPDPHELLVDHFAYKLTSRNLVSAVGGIHLWEHRSGIPRVTVWAYTVPAYHQIHDPLPVDLGIVYEWTDVVVLKVKDANRARREVDPSAPLVSWAFRIHPETLRDLRYQDSPATLWGYPASVLERTVDYGWTFYGRSLDVTPQVSTGLLHAHQILPEELSPPPDLLP